MNPIYLHIHSFVDVITNSSSEIFVSADQKTLAMVKDIITRALKLGESTKTVDDLFDVQLVFGPLSEWETGGPCVELDYLSEEGQEKWEEVRDEEYPPTVRVKVSPKVGGEDAKVLAGYLSNLTSAFDITERSNY